MYLEKYAASIGLKLDVWKKAMASEKLQKVIEQDSALAQQIGATGTPALSRMSIQCPADSVLNNGLRIAKSAS
jgi:predicted DsbA family dithiol-disulfide isomerase